ncbi:MAG: hypothetical protein RIT43_165 [Bacteroidota bacterium]
MLLDSDGFERKVLASELIKIHHTDITTDVFDFPLKDQDLPKSNVTPAKNGQQSSVPEKDLHIEVLLDSHCGMTNSEILEVQLKHLRQFFNEMRSQRKVKFVLIHGVGEGVLKGAVHQFLSNQKGVTFFAANFRKYGQGATEVRLNYTLMS